MALGLPSFTKESGVIVMTDFEMLSIVIMIIMLVITITGVFYKNDK